MPTVSRGGQFRLVHGEREVWKAGQFCFSKFFYLFHPKGITVFDSLVKREPERVEVESGTGEGTPDLARTETACLHSTSVAVCSSHK